jgi:hypothetical protein
VALQPYELLFTFAKAHFQISLVSVFIEKQLWAIDALEASIKTLNFNSNQTMLTNYSRLHVYEVHLTNNL